MEGNVRLRLSSIDPAHITDSLIELMATEPMICPQLHLSLQSANTLILKRMKRRATRQMVYERIEQLRRAVPHLVLSADLLVGFPTETSAHFRDTLDAVDDLEIAYPHVFAYSSRRGTPAARIPDQVPVNVRKRRAALVRERGRCVWRRVAERQIGTRTRVLIEGGENLPASAPPGWVRGRAANYFRCFSIRGRVSRATGPRSRLARWKRMHCLGTLPEGAAEGRIPPLNICRPALRVW